MKDKSDAELLRAYVEDQCEAAFTELTHRYVALVHSAALRMVRDPHLAEDVAQSVFVALARTAGRLKDRQVVAAWLHSTTRHIAAQVIRSEVRRRSREENAAAMNLTNHQEDAEWERIAADLDNTLDSLGEADRNLLLLRFFKNHDLRAIGVAFGISEDAAQKRVSRALERLRTMFERRGVTTTASGLGALLAARAVEAAPLPVIAAVGAAPAIAHTTFGIGLATQLLMTTSQKLSIVTAALLIGGAAVYEVQRTAAWQERMRAVEAERTALAAQLQRMTTERNDAARQLAGLGGQSPTTADHTLELLRLRREVAALRQGERERSTVGATTASWEARVAQLRQCCDRMPEKRIPEMAWLSDKDWAAAARNAELTTDDGVRQALSELRRAAKQNFLNATKEAIRAHVAAACGHPMPEDTKEFARLVNDNPALFPSDLEQLKPYFQVPVDDDLLARYRFERPDKLNEWLTDILVKEVAPPVDEEYDTRHEIGLNAGSVGPVNLVAETVMKAVKSYALAHSGQKPSTASDVAPFLGRPLPEEVVQKYLGILPSQR